MSFKKKFVTYVVINQNSCVLKVTVFFNKSKATRLSNESDDLDFSARLEISGIRQEKQSNNINTRLNTKINQTKRSDSSTLPAYVAIIEFSKLEAIILER